MSDKTTNPRLQAVLDSIGEEELAYIRSLPECEECGVRIYPDNDESINHKASCSRVEKCFDCGVCTDYIERGWSHHRDTCVHDPKC
jgi:hypothetical protein